MEILLNGQPHQIPSPCTLSLLLQQLSLQNKRLAVEINLNIVPRSEYELRELHAGDRVEIVHAIGGG
ncbi:sulfur carrier protein ThiS [Thioflexithrix psekupsensis]|uniref:Thiamine biosynthesis protein ThiS n=1 Tax=Thioflexithrix psekupsensis TaxID=1570016 RepID=A0A251XC64_9GAMM|nr:sulfur carrier protein ThiS [Thioflexithrix psekupsensis]OUD15680.1 thiamine biosynthesis protein ThiS [Thioflexithrix psekupsensis]